MKRIINSGIYNIDLQGTTGAEFYGNHPTLILKSIKNHEMYYVFPLTTYTKEKWKDCRKRGCCRITTTNSIARIDKVKILHKSEIKCRWIKDDIFIVPKPEEIEVVYKKFMESIGLSIDRSLNNYKKYYENYNSFVELLHKNFCELNLTNDFVIELETKTIIFSSSLVYHLTSDDVKHIIYSILGKDNVDISFDKNCNIIKIIIQNEKKLLTFLETYDKVNSTKGNTNKSSVNKC